MSAVGVTGSKLSEQRYVVYGAGSAGSGITKQIRDAVMQMDNLSATEANKLFYLIDRHGLIKKSLGTSNIREELQEFVRPDEEWTLSGEVGLLDVVKQVKPTVLIGCSTHAKAFTEEVVREMAKWTERPIILPLSNPSRLVEVDPKDANEWSSGKALIATGSPFPLCKMPNGKDYV
jgi:malate dehydrogenase (oxaloacetate-decarboxylating)